MKYIKVMTIPGKAIDVEADENATVHTLVGLAGMTLDQMTISLSPAVEGANANSVVPDGGTICLTRQVKGA